MTTLKVFSAKEMRVAKLLLAAQVASMSGRKFEEDDWSSVYCKTKGIPDEGWSNLHIDIDHAGLGVEFKMLRISNLGEQPIKSICGTTRMHPAATRSIRIDDTSLPADEVMIDVLQQYGDLIDKRTQRVKSNNPAGSADMRSGWLLWENNLREFLYFEEAMVKPDPDNYYAEWNERPARGIRKPSKNLWIYDKLSNKKHFSVTTSAGIKIQPYFDIPSPTDENLVYFRVQSEQLDEDTIILWVAAMTAHKLKDQLGSVDKDIVSKAILDAALNNNNTENKYFDDQPVAIPIHVSKDAFDALVHNWAGVSDDHRIQLLIQSL